jgi:hypothetical protein
VIFLCCALLILGCEEELPEAEIIDFTPVIVRWFGPPAADGCGFSVAIDSQVYKPINEEFFGQEFQIFNDTTVEMKYKDLKRKVSAGCGFGPPTEVNGIEVLEIR